MKKAISIILAVLMLLSVFSVTAMAENGPNPNKDEYEEYTAQLFFYNLQEDGGDVGIFYDNELKDTIEGAEYDIETNTLTLTDFNHPEFYLSIRDMGDDFKLNIIGECVLFRINVTTETYGGSLTVTGTGLLTVNPDKEDEVAVSISARGADSTLHIDDTVSVKFLSCWNAVNFDGTAHADKDTVFTQGDKTVNVKGEKNSSFLYVDGAYVDYENTESVGFKAHQANDPDYLQGVYAVTISQSDGAEAVYHVERYVIDEKTGTYVKDESFNPVDLTKEEFEGNYEIEKTSGDEPKQINYEDETGAIISGYLVTDENGDLYVIPVNYDDPDTPDDSMQRLTPTEEIPGGYQVKITPTVGTVEVDRRNFYSRGLSYVYDEENVEFEIPTMQSGNYAVNEDEEGNRYIFTYNGVYRIDENNKVTVDGEECYYMTPWQGITEENTKEVIIEEDTYSYLYDGEEEGEGTDDEDYIYIAPEVEETTGPAPDTEPTTDAMETSEPIVTSEPVETSATDETAAPTTEVPETGATPPATNEPATGETAASTQAPTIAPTAAPKATDPTVKEIKPGTPEKQVDKYVSSLKTENDAKGTTFGLLCARQKKATKKSVTVKWNKLKNAKYYVVYGSKCGTKKGQIPPYKKIKTVKNNSYTKKGLKRGTYFKFIIVALDKNKKVLASSKTVHIATKGGKVGNDKTVKVNKTKVTLKVKKTFKIKGKEVAQSKKLKVKRHRKLRYESSNKKVAKVNGKGKVTAKKKGTAYIYVYAQNGLYKKVKITVK